MYKIYGTAVATGTCGGWSSAVKAVRAEGCGWAVEAALCWLVVNMGRSLWRGRRE